MNPDLGFTFFQNTTLKSKKFSQDTRWRQSAPQLQTVWDIRSSVAHSRSKSLSTVSAIRAWYWPLWVAERCGAARQLAAPFWGLVSLSPIVREVTGAEWLSRLLKKLNNGMPCIYSTEIISIFHTMPTPLYVGDKIARVNSCSISEQTKHFANTFYQGP